MIVNENSQEILKTIILKKWILFHFGKQRELAGNIMSSAMSIKHIDQWVWDFKVNKFPRIELAKEIWNLDDMNYKNDQFWLVPCKPRPNRLNSQINKLL